VALTVVILFGLLVASVWTDRAIARLGAAEHPEGIAVVVTGHQWWWEIEYEDPTPSRRVTTANEIHIPVGHPVVFKVTSQDVIHSFWVPNLHGKRDLIPGYTTAIWLQADRPGIYRGQCAEFCGHNHATMAFWVIAESDDAFHRWLDDQRQQALEPSDETARHGRDVFLSGSCAMCHQIRGTGASARYGPDLTHLATRGSIAAATLSNSHDQLADWIVHAQSVKPRSRMPPNPLPNDDLQALVAYLGTLK
jgi:cytochrome c oxidase subunit 2